jgi:hypothetical protein
MARSRGQYKKVTQAWAVTEEPFTLEQRGDVLFLAKGGTINLKFSASEATALLRVLLLGSQKTSSTPLRNEK